ncbi:MAG: hypothetical protein GX295_11755 [Syntrophomonadaceae bacterium]|nr:hypothetical protein [Syntrophomonadaceae bacterium]
MLLGDDLIKKRAVIIGGALFLLLIGRFVYGQYYDYQIEKAVNNITTVFLKAVVEGEANKAKEHTSGHIMWDLAARELPSAKLIQLTTETTAYSDTWAQVESIVQLECSDGLNDVGFYTVSLSKENGEWKVVDFLKEAYFVKGKTLRATEVQSREIKTVFSSFLNNLIDNKTLEAKKQLAGVAKEAYEWGLPKTTESPIKSFSDLQVESLWFRDKTTAAKFVYKVDNRPVEVIVYFYKTLNDGWKIIKI